MPAVKDWDALPKPWSRDNCRDRYVMGDKIGLRKLAEISGATIGAIFGWSADEDWPSKRREFSSKTAQKTQEAVSDAIADKAAAILERHYEGFKSVESLGLNLAVLAERAAEQMAIEDDIDLYKFQSLTSAANNAANVFKTAIQGQRQALWLDLENVNAAITVVENHGYRVAENDSKDAAADYPIPNQSFVEVAPDDISPAP